jgi:hypothetical protein
VWVGSCLPMFRQKAVPRSFLRAFEIKKYIKSYVKMPCKRVSLSISGPVGEPGGVSRAGAFR